MSHILYDMPAKKVTNNNTSFDNLLSKYRAKDLSKVVDFLSSISRRSKKTAFSYSFGLNHFNKFVEHNYNNKYNIETILEQLQEGGQNKINVYNLLNSFILYLQNDTINAHDLTPLSVKLYMTGVRSYLAYNDIEISPTRFKHKVKMPTEYHEDEEAINAKDIKKILDNCFNRRLKAYLLVLASSGMRAVEALAIRERDINRGKGIDLNNISPTEVRVRKEYAKTRRERHIFISDEAAEYLKQWIEWKHRDRHAENKYAKNRVRNTDDLVFSVYTTSKSKDPHGLYFKVLLEFQKVLDVTELNGRKEGGVDHRRKITFHSFRRFVKTRIADATNTDFSEWFLGHKKSTYYVKTSDEYREVYKEKCMHYLTFLKSSTVETIGKTYEAKLLEKEQEIEQLRQLDKTNTERIANLETRFDELLRVSQEALHMPPTKEEHFSREQIMVEAKEVYLSRGIPDEEAEYLARETAEKVAKAIEKKKKK